MADRSDSSARPSARGCGLLSRESLEHVAQARIDHTLRPDELALAHVLLCEECRAAVDRLVVHRRLVTELARLERSEPVARSQDDDHEQIPGYRIINELHRGGQGTVFLAEQTSTRRKCAVKMLIGGRFASPMERVRFEREVEVVGAMRHPGIVTLYESGVSRTGEPWFAMEFVEGERLDEFVKRAQPAPRDLAKLLRRVAEAVAYAHRRGVIHRDLKPGNILIDREGEPRVLDFGLARLASVDRGTDVATSSTQGGQFVGTFTYAAPEQLMGDPSAVDSRCDLYALGVTFYECLTGALPIPPTKSIGELARMKSEGRVRRPRELLPTGTRPIDTDLEVIVLRLLAADPSRRYVTADALAEDLDRYLDGRPILAREDSKAYVAWKTIRRYWLLSGVAAALAVTVVGGSIALAVAFNRARVERGRVELAYRAFQNAIESADPEAAGGASTMTVAEFLKQVQSRAQTALASEPESLAEIELTIGLVQLGFDESIAPSDAIFAAYETLSRAHAEGRATDNQLAKAAAALARLRFHRGDFAGSEAAYRQALEIRERLFGPNAIETVDTLRQLSAPVKQVGRLDETETLLQEALRRSESFPRDESGAVAKAAVLNSIALLASLRGDDEAALRKFEATLKALAPVLAPDDFRIGRTLYSLASVEFRLGLQPDALEHVRRAHEILLRRKGPEARWTAEAAELLLDVESAK